MTGSIRVKSSRCHPACPERSRGERSEGPALGIFSLFLAVSATLLAAGGDNPDDAGQVALPLYILPLFFSLGRRKQRGDRFLGIVTEFKHEESAGRKRAGSLGNEARVNVAPGLAGKKRWARLEVADLGAQRCPVALGDVGRIGDDELQGWQRLPRTEFE